MVGEDLVYSLILTPFINSVSCLLCQPPFWGCQSRPKLVPQEAEAAKAKGSCSHYWRRHIQHTGRLVFAFFGLNYRWCVFWVPKIGPTHKRLVQGSVSWWIFGWYVSAHVRLAISCTGWWMFFGNHRGYRFPSISAISKRTWIIWIYIVTWIFFCDFLVLQLVPHISSIPFFIVFLVLYEIQIDR